MKRVLSYLLLLAYSTVILMPVLPYISDTVAHTFWLYEHISTVHYEHGKYHTHYEAAAIAKKTAGDKTTPLSKYTNSADDHDMASITYQYFCPITAKPSFTNYNLTAIATHLFSDYPPPKC